MTICGKPAEKPQKRIKERLDFPPAKFICKKMKDDHAHTVVPAVSCLLGFPCPVLQFGPGANLQVTTCAAPGPPTDLRTGVGGGKMA
jgi:hypothetical protein